MYIFFFLAAVVAAPLPVSVNVFSNSGLAGSPVLYAFPSLSLTVPAQAQPYYSAEVTTQVAVTPGWWAFDCAGAFGVGVSLGYVWVDDHLVCAGSGANQSSPYANKVSGTDGTLAYPIFARPGSGRATWLIRAHLYVNASGGFVSGPSFSFPWCSPAAPGAPCAFSPIPPGALAAGLPPGEAARASLQRSLATGWGLWLHDNILTAALLPAGLRLSLAVCPLGGGGSCATAAVPDDGNVRVGAHASDRSIAQFFVGAPGVNVSVTVLGGAELSVLVEAVGGAGAGANYAVAVSADFVWRRGGAVASDGAVLTAAPAGLPVVAVRGGGGAAVDPDALPPAVRARPLIALSLAAGAVAFGTAGGAPPSVPAVRAAADVAAAVEAARHLKYGDLAEAAQGVHAAVAWNMIFTPAEVGPVPPVSRSWSAVRSNPAEADPGQWGYVIFAWDNQLAALLAGLNSSFPSAQKQPPPAPRAKTNTLPPPETLPSRRPAGHLQRPNSSGALAHGARVRSQLQCGRRQVGGPHGAAAGGARPAPAARKVQRHVDRRVSYGRPAGQLGLVLEEARHAAGPHCAGQRPRRELHVGGWRCGRHAGRAVGEWPR